jgi:FlgD Ig-like domain
MADAIENQLGRTVWLDTNRMNSSSYPDGSDRNSQTATLLNATNPDLVVMLASGSFELAPGNFFIKHPSYAQWPWLWNNLWLTHDVPIVLVPSCGSCGFPDNLYGVNEQETCQDFFSRNGAFQCGAGSVIWIGAQKLDVDQAMNWAFESLVLEELVKDPTRAVADSYLVALNRMYDSFPTKADALNRMICLGDPLSAFRRSPNHVISAFVQKAGSTQLLPMQNNFAVGCPGGDADKIVITVALDAADVPSPLSDIDITATHASTTSYYSVRIYLDGARFPATGPIQSNGPSTGFPAGSYTAKITLPSFGGCGTDSVLVSLYGAPLGYVPINVRSPDIMTSGGNNSSYGKMSLLDFEEFIKYYPPPKPYSPCADYVAPFGSPVTLGDYSFFAVHYLGNHQYSSAFLAGDASAAQVSNGSVRVDLREEDPLLGDRILHATISLTEAEPYKLMVLALRTDNPTLEYLGWNQASSYAGETMCAEVEPSEGRTLFLGVVGTKDMLSGSGTLGEATFRINSDAPLSLAADDFGLVTADILSSGDNQTVLPTSRLTRAVAPVAYRNALAQNYPNPFNPTTTIAYSMAKASHVNLDIFDVRGLRVRTLVAQSVSAGNHTVNWDGLDQTGNRVASGVYFYRLKTSGFQQTKKMVMLR